MSLGVYLRILRARDRGQAEYTGTLTLPIFRGRSSPPTYLLLHPFQFLPRHLPRSLPGICSGMSLGVYFRFFLRKILHARDRGQVEYTPLPDTCLYDLQRPVLAGSSIKIPL